MHVGPSLRRPVVALPAAALAVLLLAVALALFQPWRLLTSRTVVEASPLDSASAAPAMPAPAPSASAPSASAPSAPTPATLLTGRFVSHEHATRGTARLIRLTDGSSALRLEGLDTSDGPDLHVWLTDQEVLPGTSGWRVFDDGRHLDLGPLKGNKGDQNYPVPAGADLTGLDSVSVWCARFHVSFGAAALIPA